MITKINRPVQIIFVGPVGAGKSHIIDDVAKYFALKEIKIIKADTLGREIVTDPINRDTLVSLFDKYGMTILINGAVNTALLLEAIMSNDALCTEFDTFQKPLILEEYNQLVKEFAEDALFPDVQFVFFECGPALSHITVGQYAMVIGLYVSEEVQKMRLFKDHPHYPEKLIEYLQARQTRSILERLSDYFLDTSKIVYGSKIYEEHAYAIASIIKSKKNLI